jgi:small subunit ribosomal protein S20
MPNTKSAKKRLKQNLDRRARNRADKSILRKKIRETRQAVATGTTDVARVSFGLTAKELDRAGSRGTIHPNKAARLKSRLHKQLKAKAQKG